jgi:hypothetical protein
MLEFRPHHFLCTLGFEGKGYSDEFVKNYQSIADRLRRSPLGDEVEIRVVGATDSICAPCPNRRGESCVAEAKIGKLDAAHQAVLGLRAGEALKWRDAREKIAKEFTDEKFEAACAPCAWKSLGVCKSALERVRAEFNRDG